MNRIVITPALVNRGLGDSGGIYMSVEGEIARSTFHAIFSADVQILGAVSSAYYSAPSELQTCCKPASFSRLKNHS